MRPRVSRAGAHFFCHPGYQAFMRSTSARSIAYAVRELGRRAGAQADWIAAWSISVSDNEVVVRIDRQRGACLRFPFDGRKANRYEVLRSSPPAMLHYPLGAATAGKDVVVPFTEYVNGPIFTVSGEEVRFRADVLTSTLWTLGRYEEIREPGGRDEHARFRGADSHAGRYGYLDRPIVDEIATSFGVALRALVPSWKPPARQLRAKVSHDIDLVGLPRQPRTIAGHLFTRRAPRAFARDAIAALTGTRTVYLDAALDLQSLSRARGLSSAFYWMAVACPTEHDVGYDVSNPLVTQTIARLVAEGAEHGIHPGYETFGDQEVFSSEIDRLRTVIGDADIGGRQHYLRWAPQTWAAWERAGLRYDGSVGFADAMGFRAGTAHPYHPWLIEEDRESRLLEIPLHVMDCTPVAYMGLGEDAALAGIRGVIERCKAVGGVFSLLWHNTSIIEQPYARLYPQILDMLDGARQYDWRSESALAPLPHVVETAAAP